MSTSEGPSARLLKLAEVQHKTSLSRSTIYRMIGRGAFPRPMQVTASIVRWKEQDVDAWIESIPPAGRFS